MKIAPPLENSRISGADGLPTREYYELLLNLVKKNEVLEGRIEALRVALNETRVNPTISYPPIIF